MGRRIVGSGSGDAGASGHRAGEPRTTRTTRTARTTDRAAAATGSVRAGRVARSSASSASASAKAAGRVPVKGAKTARTASGAVARAKTPIERRAGRSVAGHAGEPHAGPATGFVDARRMPSDDVVARTLGETVGTLGVASRPKVVDFTARRKERRMADMRATAVRVTAAVLAVAAVAGLAWLLFFSTVFRLEKSAIEISGDNAWVSRDDIMAIAGKQAGRSLFLVSTNDVADALGDIPGVTEANVVKRFPKSLTVSVKAQQPAAMLKDSGDELVAVDDRGRELNKVGSTSTDGIPVIEVKSIDKALDSSAVKEAIGVLSSLDDAMRASITKVSADTRDSVVTELDDGAHTVRWGDSSQIELKKAIVETILADPNVIGDKTQIDVSAPSRPIIK